MRCGLFAIGAVASSARSQSRSAVSLPRLAVRPLFDLEERHES